MAKDHGSSVKSDKQYEGLRKKGMSKQRAASIANSPDASSKGGKKSGKGSGGSKSQKRAAGREGGKYTVLTDPKGLFGYQNVAPIVSKKVLANEGPAFADTLNAVSAKLTVEAMRKMNGAVDLDKQDAAKVADQFLKANGLK